VHEFNRIGSGFEGEVADFFRDSGGCAIKPERACRECDGCAVFKSVGVVGATRVVEDERAAVADVEAIDCAEFARAE